MKEDQLLLTALNPTFKICLVQFMRENKVPNIKQNLAQVLKECIAHINDTLGSNDKAKYNK